MRRGLAFAAALPASGLDPNDRRFIGASATELEIAAGALAVPDASEHVVAVFRSIEGLPHDESARAFTDVVPSEVQRALQQGVMTYLLWGDQRLYDVLGSIRSAWGP